jgi:phosphoglycolate phosphatase
MPIRLIIFDLDGTLVDTISDITNALNYAFEPSGAGTFTSDETAGLVGEGASKLIQRAAEKRGVNPDLRVLLERFAEFYETHFADNTTVYPGVKETLDTLIDYKKTIVSNKFEDLSRKILGYLGLSKYFETVIGSDTMSEQKPSPMAIYHILSALAVKPEEAIIVGDSAVDVRTGKAASIRTVAVTYGYGRSGFQDEADFVISSFPQLTGLIKDMK